MIRNTLIIALLLTGASHADVYMKLAEEPICFIEEIGPELGVINLEYLVREGDLSETHHPNKEGLGSMAEANFARPFTITVVDPEGGSILNRDIGDLYGSVSWKVNEKVIGAYEICLKSRADAQATREKPILLTFRIDHRLKGIHKPAPKRDPVSGKTGPGGMAIETYVEEGGQVKEVLKSVEELERIHDELQELKDRIKEIRREGNYFQDRQSRFIKTTNSTSDRLFWFSVATVGIVVASAVYQYYHLKSFLLKKKLV
eukprot:TRINITY_DN20303_c0_g1_i1.p1 TRINITY_DN20303_c0_g1~~TRINITY_DN20303_c0_g1_i1.p1  ORF type:complete len:259 (+),score=50.72 TRINITY_DN20303_c0_g1_i1:44-820(+)